MNHICFYTLPIKTTKGIEIRTLKYAIQIKIQQTEGDSWKNNLNNLGKIIDKTNEASELGTFGCATTNTEEKINFCEGKEFTSKKKHFTNIMELNRLSTYQKVL